METRHGVGNCIFKLEGFFKAFVPVSWNRVMQIDL